jgi:hypothetical protein
MQSQHFSQRLLTRADGRCCVPRAQAALAKALIMGCGPGPPGYGRSTRSSIRFEQR